MSIEWLRGLPAGVTIGDLADARRERDMLRALSEKLGGELHAAITERDRLAQEVADLRAALEGQIALWEQVPPGPDMDARDDETSPPDAVAWLAGHAIKRARKALGASKEGTEP